MQTNAQEQVALKIIDVWLDNRLRYSDLPGFQVCIRKQGELIFSKAYGYANLKTQRPLKTTDLFHIASHSKTITACALFKLFEADMLSLLEPALNYLPELKNHKDKRFRDITIRDLLSNRSGIFRDGLDTSYWDLDKPFLTKEELISEILSTDLIYDPNTVTKYSNMGFALLGLILEKVMSIPYPEAIQKLVFDNLPGATFYADYQEQASNAYADGHMRALERGERLPLKHAPVRALAAATGVCANAEDTSLFFDRLLLGEGLISKASQREITSLSWPVKNSTNERYGLGVLSDRFGDIELIGHSGGYPGFVTQTRNWVGTDYILSCFINTNTSINLQAIRSLAEILDKIKTTFTEDECKEASISPPLMDKWGSYLFVVTPRKALCFNLESWLPCEDALPLEGEAGVYVCPKESGFGSLGERITFARDSSEAITSVTWGGSTLCAEEVFLQKAREATL